MRKGHWSFGARDRSFRSQSFRLTVAAVFHPALDVGVLTWLQHDGGKLLGCDRHAAVHAAQLLVAFVQRRLAPHGETRYYGRWDLCWKSGADADGSAAVPIDRQAGGLLRYDLYCFPRVAAGGAWRRACGVLQQWRKVFTMGALLMFSGLGPFPTNDHPVRKTILLVDDEELLLELTARVLRKGGYVVLEAQDAERALRVVQTEGAIVQLLISDVGLPGVSGLQLFEALRKTHPHLKAIFISGFVSDDMRGGDPLPGSAVFLQKPYENIDLIEAVQGLLG